MASGYNQLLLLVEEDTYGHTKTSTPITIPVRLDGDNAFTPAPVKMYHNIRSADASNRRVVRVAGRESVGGKLTIKGYSDFGTGTLADTVPFIGRMFDWGTTLVSNGAPVPAYDLKSYTARHWDGIRWREYLGVKVQKLHFFANPTTDEGCWTLELDLIAQKPNAVDPTVSTLPALTAYSKAPYVLQESRGGIIAATSGTTPRVVQGFDVTVSNMLDGTWDDDFFITDCTWNGRDVDWQIPIRFTSKADRDAFEAQTSYSGSVVLTKVSPAHTLTLTFEAANFVDGIDRSLILSKPTYETLHFCNDIDIAAGTDFVAVAT